MLFQTGSSWSQACRITNDGNQWLCVTTAVLVGISPAMLLVGFLGTGCSGLGICESQATCADREARLYVALYACLE
jgi:hypothetical protein